MKLMLTSFGITEDPGNLRSPHYGLWMPHQTDLPLTDSPLVGSVFYMMPPVSMRELSNVFMPDYSVLLLCEKVVLDKASFEALQRGRHDSYAAVAQTMQALAAEGFLETVNYKTILSDNRSLLQKMTDNDLCVLEQWIEPLKESIALWHGFCEKNRGLPTRDRRDFLATLTDQHQNWILQNWIKQEDTLYGSARAELEHVHSVLDDALRSARKRRKRECREALRQVLGRYLSYVNANIILSNELRLGFHDWMDYLPFYRKKFLSIGREELETQRAVSAVSALFDISFPEFAVRDAESLLRLLRDRRIESLRRLVQDAVDGTVTFDQSFARHTLKEVLQIERRVTQWRRVISYLTIPIHLVPLIGPVAHKGTEEVIGAFLERRLQRPFRWFYLLSDVAGEPESRAEN